MNIEKYVDLIKAVNRHRWMGGKEGRVIREKEI